jgi:hypothetical protein
MSKSSLAVIANELEKTPARMRYARRALMSLQHDGLRAVRKNPGRSILGALAVGFIVAKIARRY